MSHDDQAGPPLPPLGPSARAAISAEKQRGDVDPALESRLLGRVLASVAVTASVATAAASTAAAARGAASDAGGTGAPTATGAAGASGAGATSAIASGAGTTLGVTAKAIPLLVGVFVAGGAVGAAIHSAMTGAPTVPVVSTAVTPRATPAPSAGRGTTLPVDSADPPPVPVGSLPSANGGAGPSAGSARSGVVALPPPSSSRVEPPRPDSRPDSSGRANDTDLAAERTLVDRARTALSRGQPADALEALDAHAKRYPRGRLTEEREALAVDALARSGKVDDARARANRFRAAYPNSVFRSVVDTVAPR